MIIAIKTHDLPEEVFINMAYEKGWSPTILVDGVPTDNPIDAPTHVAMYFSNKITTEDINPSLIRQTQGALSDEYNAKMNAAEQAVREQTKDLLSFTIE